MTATDNNLVPRAIAGQEQALTLLLKQVGPQLRAKLTIGRKWQAALDPADVLQVTYLEAFLRVRELNATTVAQFAAWITRIAENNLRDAIKELSRQKRPDPARRVQPAARADSHVMLLENVGWTSTTPSRVAAVDEARQALNSTMARLPELYQQVIRLYDLDGGSPGEVAEKMGRSIGAVHMLRARAHDRLREIFGPRSRFFSKSP